MKKYPTPSYLDLHPKLESKVKNGSRSSYAERSLAQKIGSDYKLVEHKKTLQTYPTISGFENNLDTILSIEDQYYTGGDLYE